MKLRDEHTTWISWSQVYRLHSSPNSPYSIHSQHQSDLLCVLCVIYNNATPMLQIFRWLLLIKVYWCNIFKTRTQVCFPFTLFQFCALLHLIMFLFLLLSLYFLKSISPSTPIPLLLIFWLHLTIPPLAFNILDYQNNKKIRAYDNKLKIRNKSYKMWFSEIPILIFLCINDLVLRLR